MKVKFYNAWKGNPTWAINFLDIYLILKGCPSFDIIIFNFTFSLEWGKWTRKMGR